jgi:hypothetical protein
MRFFRKFKKNAPETSAVLCSTKWGGSYTYWGVCFLLGGCACCHCGGQGQPNTSNKSQEQPERTEGKEPAIVNNAGARFSRQNLFLDVGGVPRCSFFLARGRVFLDRTLLGWGACA